MGEEPADPTEESRVGRLRCGRCCGCLLLLLLLLVGGVYLAEADPPLSGTPGPEAEARVDRMLAATHAEAWERTRALRWTFGGRNTHLWDRDRHLARVRSGDLEALINLHTKQGRVWRDGVEVTGDELGGLLHKAWFNWVNDSFWLNPIPKARDAGTTREALELNGQEGVLVRYASGGATPGDSYLWLLDENGRPTAWRMWVSIIPIPGIDATWEGWITLDTGAQVSTRHRLLGLPLLQLDDVAGAARLSELEPGPDPFAPLFE